MEQVVLIMGKDAFSMHRYKGSGLRVYLFVSQDSPHTKFQSGKGCIQFPFPATLYVEGTLCVCTHVYVCARVHKYTHMCAQGREYLGSGCMCKVCYDRELQTE